MNRKELEAKAREAARAAKPKLWPKSIWEHSDVFKLLVTMYVAGYLERNEEIKKQLSF